MSVVAYEFMSYIGIMAIWFRYVIMVFRTITYKKMPVD